MLLMFLFINAVLLPINHGLAVGDPGSDPPMFEGISVAVDDTMVLVD